MPTFYEFFAGGGMARAGLGVGWTCLFANDIDPKKGAAYRDNWGDGELRIGDVRALDAETLPGQADLVWASFPCQDLSLAGGGLGLEGARSGVFYPFWEVVKGLVAARRAPKIVALENVCGLLTSHGGRDFAAICHSFLQAGYRHGALVVDAALFVPQSRPRLFFVGVRDDVPIDPSLTTPGPCNLFHSRGLQAALQEAGPDILQRWLWWRLPQPARRNLEFADLIEEAPTDVEWRPAAETRRLLDLMSPIHLAKVEEAKKCGRRMVGGVYRRTRYDEEGRKVQRAEIRFDDIAGCLRTPAGGSSRQIIVLVDGRRVRSRLISARETARLMGLDDEYVLPQTYSEAYSLTGDGVVVPVVRHLAQHLFEPLLKESVRAAA
jgi:DNA (cytosine-5)-methyltransferase 1